MPYFRVKDKLRNVPSDFHFWGYETENDFSTSLRNIHRKWNGHIGERIDFRNDFSCIRFVNSYGYHEDAWIPDFMLEQVPDPADTGKKERSGDIEDELDRIFGFE